MEEDENKNNNSTIYMAANGAWVFVAKFNVDLTNYYTKLEIADKLEDYYTKTETDNQVSVIEDNLDKKLKVIAIRGAVKTYAALPDITGERIGDAYIVEKDETNNGISIIYTIAEIGGIKQWVYVAQFIVDLTNYYNKEEIQEMFLDKYYTNDEIDNKLVIIEDKIVLLNDDLLNYYTKQVIDNKVDTLNTEIGTQVTNHNTDLSSHGIDAIKTDITTHNTNTQNAHGIDTIKNDISELQTKVANIDVISIKGSVDTYAALPDNTNLLIGTAYIVEKDENKNNITTIYAIEDNAGVKEWVFIGEFKVDLSNYYNKNEVEELIDIDLIDYYNKEQIDDKLDGKIALDYSLAEQDTGRKWIDGKIIYQKTFEWLPNTAFNGGSNIIIGTIAAIIPGATFIIEAVPIITGSMPRFKSCFTIGIDGANLKCWDEWGTVSNKITEPIIITIWYTK